MKAKIFSGMLLLALSGFSAVAGATDTLISERGGQVVYDQTTSLSWIANADLAATNTFGVSGISTNGAMTWNTAQSWIAAMDAAKYLGYSDWRLPTSVDCYVGTCISTANSEMRNLFYNGLGQVAGQSIGTTHNSNYGLFQNVQTSSFYWSGTVHAVYYPIVFYTGNGTQYYTSESNDLFALAVRPGQVSAVPEPSTYVMMLAGLSMVGFIVYRRKNDSSNTLMAA